MTMQPSVKQSLLNYKGIKYGEINNLLRNGSIPSEKSKMTPAMLKDPTIRDILNIDSVMKNDNSMKNKLLYRGVHGLTIQNEGVLVNKAYSSSSTDIDVSMDFIEGNCCIIAFEIPSEITFFPFNILGRDNESEYLINRNTQFVEFRHTNTYKGVRVYSCILKLYAVPIITKSDLEKRAQVEEALRAATIKMIQDDDDDSDFERFLAEEDSD